MSLELANAGKVSASRTRAAELVSLSRGETTIPHLLETASREDGRPLRRITLRQLLMAQDGWGRAQARQVLSRITQLLGHEPTARLTVAWLLDARAGGRRIRALADAMTDRAVPWIGFPYAPLPAGGGSE